MLMSADDTAGSRQPSYWRSCGKSSCVRFRLQGSSIMRASFDITGHPEMPRIIEHEVPYPDSHPYILTFGPDGGLWFCDNGAGQICRMDIGTGAFRAFPLPRRDCQPVGIITGHDGHLW